MKKCNSKDYDVLIDFIRNIYGFDKYIPLHEPSFDGNELKYIKDCIDSTYVSSVGKYVDKFESLFADYVGSKYAIATVNGTAALHVALRLVGIDNNSDVITQPLSFVATSNAIRYCGAQPIYVDVSRNTLGMCPDSLYSYLKTKTFFQDGFTYSKLSNRRIGAVLPMHTFGHPCAVDELLEICDKFNLPLIEDSAESIGSLYKSKHTGTFGKFGTFSFNGNKTITTGGGGMIITNNYDLAKKAKHITTTSKVKDPYRFIHDEVGYNYRLPNINSALGCAQIENLQKKIRKKRALAKSYKNILSTTNFSFFNEPKKAKSNFWLNTLILSSKNERDSFLKITNEKGIMTRPAWTLNNKLEMFKECECHNLDNSNWLEDRLVNIPSSV